MASQLVEKPLDEANIQESLCWRSAILANQSVKFWWIWLLLRPIRAYETGNPLICFSSPCHSETCCIYDLRGPKTPLLYKNKIKSFELENSTFRFLIPVTSFWITACAGRIGSELEMIQSPSQSGLTTIVFVYSNKKSHVTAVRLC